MKDRPAHQDGLSKRFLSKQELSCGFSTTSRPTRSSRRRQPTTNSPRPGDGQAFSPDDSRCLRRSSDVRGLTPNKRLKLTGADRSKGTGMLCAAAHELSFND